LWFFSSQKRDIQPLRRVAREEKKKKSGKALSFAAALSLGVLEVMQYCEN
jgi:hypothetical protein